MRSTNGKEIDLTTVSTLNPKEWVMRHADYLYAYAWCRLQDEELAKDLVQETFLAALEKVNQFKKQSSERTWLTAILKYKIINVYRRKGAGIAAAYNSAGANQDPENFFNPADGHWRESHQPQVFSREDPDPLTEQEFITVLQQCLQKLPALWLAVFTLKHLDEEPTEIICRDLKVTSANFWVIIHRAKLHLRACLQKNWV